MSFRSIFNPKYYLLNTGYKETLKLDEYALSTFRNGNGVLSREEKKMMEYKCVRYIRIVQCNMNNFWGKYYNKKLKKNGVDLYNNRNIGEGLVIGHIGRIIINGQAIIGKQLMITHGVTIGRDIRGKRKGSPVIGDRVSIRANSTVVGKIKIGNDVLIAPNTFVNFDVPEHSIVIGNPARIISRDNATEGHIGRLPDEK